MDLRDDGVVWTGLIWPAGEHGNETSGSLKYLGCSWVAAQLAASQEGLSSMKDEVGIIYKYLIFHKPQTCNYHANQ
jgi:hypothetical protein